LAQGEKLDQFIALCLREGLKDYLQLILDIGHASDPSVILQNILEVSKMKYQIREETWPVIDQFLKEMPEYLWELPTFREHTLSMQQQARQQSLQQALIRQLRCKFSQVPHGIVQHIEATFDIEQLNNWLDQIISASDLAEMGFSQEHQKGLSHQE
jgi:hypothetical protein